MRFMTIWTLEGMPLRERLNRTRDWGALKIAHHLPRRIAYWSFIDTGVRYMERDEVVPEVLYNDLLARVCKEAEKA